MKKTTSKTKTLADPAEAKKLNKPSSALKGRPLLEVIACVANCAGYYEDGMQVNFDLRDNMSGRVYKNLSAVLHEGEWDLDTLCEKLPSPVLPRLSALRAETQDEINQSTFEEHEDIILEELNRWTRNLFALARRESKSDTGYHAYKRVLAELKDEYRRAGQDYGSNESFSKFWNGRCDPNDLNNRIDPWSRRISRRSTGTRGSFTKLATSARVPTLTLSHAELRLEPSKAGGGSGALKGGFSTFYKNLRIEVRRLGVYWPDVECQTG